MAMGRVGESTPSWQRRARVSWKVWRRRLRHWERHLVRNAVFVLFEPSLPAPEPNAFYELNLTGGVTARTVLISAGLHILLMSTPAPAWLATLGVGEREPTEAEIEAQQLATSHVLPPIYPRRMPKREPSPGGREGEPLPPRGAERVQPQTIVSSPPNPNHPRQTLLQQLVRARPRPAPSDVRLPNMVLPDDPAATPVPEIDLGRLRVPGAPLDTSGPPRAPALPRPRRDASQLSLRAAKPANPIPRLTLPEAAGADDLGTGPSASVPPGVPRSGDLAAPGVLELSAAPAAPQRRLRLPDENLRARFVAGPHGGSGSPGGVPGGTPGASGGSGGGPGGIAGGGEGLIVPDILVTPAGDVPPGPVIVGPQGGGAPPAPRRQAAESRTGASAASNAAPAPAPAPAPPPSPQERGRALLEAVEKGGGGPRRLYVTYLYLANLTSQSSSWLLQFAESLVGNPAAANPEALLVPPQVRKKVDPCYPNEPSFTERVEGVVVVYGLIRADGRVEDPVVMRGINPRIDQAALDAFSRSLFEPARKRGKAVAIDALVEIPFRFAPCQ